MLCRSNAARRVTSVLVLLLAVTLCVGAAGASGLTDFTFIHTSDVHAPMTQSKATIAKVQGLGEIDFKPYGFTAPKPSFALVTGDLNEFGGGSGWWQEYMSYWKDCGMPVYSVLGNHDNAWYSGIKALRDLGKGPYYSFDSNGCHFVGLMTPTPQDPRPSIGEEQINWLKSDLEKVGTSTPVFVFFHHPLSGTEFASRYDYDRLLDVLSEHNTVLMMAGHSHGHVHDVVRGIDQVTGGSTFGPNVGLSFVSVKEGKLRVAYWKADQPAPDLGLLEKAIPEKAPYPVVEIETPTAGQSLTGILRISAKISNAPELNKATFTVDDAFSGDMSMKGQTPKWTAEGSVSLSQLKAGSHYLRVEFSAGDQVFSRSTEFFYETPNRPTSWRAYLGASSKVTPTVADGVVYVGANDGKLRAFDAKTGKEKWCVDTGAEILAQPLIEGDKVYTANGKGLVSAHTKAGKPAWTFTAGEAVYSSPVMAEGKVVFGCNDGKLYAVDATTGKQAWVCEDATYAVESKPFVWNGRVYYGAWDQYVRCVDAKTGDLLWKQLSEGSRTQNAKRYYSPGDAMPVVCDGKLIIADRNYDMLICNAETGERLSTIGKVMATALSEDGKFVYLRRKDVVEKIDSSGTVVWTGPAMTDTIPMALPEREIPAAPVERNGVVYAVNTRGTVFALSADAGKLLWQYQASPRLYVMSSVACDDRNAYVTAFDGYLTAINCSRAATPVTGQAASGSAR